MPGNDLFRKYGKRPVVKAPNHHLHGLTQGGPDMLRQPRKIDRPAPICGHVSDLDSIKMGLHDLNLLQCNKLA
jgi:hypothetical protein